jgi:ABC-type sugar transport system permease subunit
VSASTAATPESPERVDPPPRSARNRGWWTPYAFLGPGVALVTVIMIYPVFYGVWLSLNETNPFTGITSFVGAQQYLDLFAQEQFQNALRQSLILVAGTVILGIAVSMSFALVLDRAPRGSGIIRAMILVPWLISGIAVATIWRAIFSPTGGFADTVLLFFGIDPITWFSSGFWSMFVIILVSIWSISPFSTLIIYAGLKTVNLEMYEAASIDGAGFFATFRFITLPSIAPQLALALVFLSFAAFNSFDIILLATGGGPGRSTEVLALLLYRIGFEQLDFNAGAAVMVVLLVINLVLSALYLRLLPREEASA